MPIPVIKGNLLDAPEDYICHQCNSITTKSKGLSSAIFERFPEADIYKDRQIPDTPGTIKIRGRIINMIAQYYPGPPKFGNDTTQMRKYWFSECLAEIETHLKGKGTIVRLALPWRIGCGLAGGNWNEYLQVLEYFAAKNSDWISVVLYNNE